MGFKICLFSIVETKDDVREYLGISYIKAYLESKGLDCDSRVIYKAEIESTLLGFEVFPKLIGISIYCNTQELVKQFCNRVKELSPGCHIVLGGAHVYDYEKDILLRLPAVDSVCTGDGEETIYELAERLINGESLLDCKGLTFRLNGELVQNAKRPGIEKLDILPLPYRERNPNNKKRYFYIAGSRGCLGKCTFCAEHKTGGCGVRLRTPQNIVDEMEGLWNKYKINKFHFTDATFEDPGSPGRERAYGIFEEIIKRNLTFRLVMYTRTNVVAEMEEEYYELAYRAGVECFFVGLETGNSEDMKLYVKKASVADNLRAIKRILSHNIYVNYGFICFNPYSTYETIQENLDFLYKSGLVFNSYHILSKLTIMPQAALKNKLMKDGLIEEFHFDSNIKQYRFIHPEIYELHKILYGAIDTKHLIDYDSQIAIDRIHYKKTNPRFYDLYLNKIFDEITSVWEERKVYLYKFFTQAIRLHKLYKADKHVLEFIKQNTIHDYDKRIKHLYFKTILVNQKGKSRQGV